MSNLTIFDIMYKNYIPKKKIRLIEFFAGYGSQALALKYLNIPFEHWKICEWAVKSIQAYKDIHFTNEYYEHNEYDEEYSIDDCIEYLYKKGISSNYNEPMTREQIKRLSDKQIINICDNIFITHNLVNIQQVKGKDLEIVNTDEYDYILTYSFPCQDLSLAGKGKGMSDTSTRSGMLWEVERILTECYELGTMPKILLMENVTQVHGSDNVNDFNKWQLRLEELGYKNYFQDLIATDYGIPQIRNRCFMVSILGDYNYTFPKPIPLKLRLKDMEEKEVDEKYFLSDKMLEYCYGVNQKESKFPRGERFIQSLTQTNGNGIATTITTSAGNRPTDNFILIPENTKKGYAIATDRDGIYINRPHQKRGVVQKDKIQTIKTSCDDIAVIVKDTENYIEWQEEGKLDIDCRAFKEEKVSSTIVTSPKNKVLLNNLRIRKLTPKECFRLMGVKDEDFEKVRKNQSESSLYHLAGDSLVTTVMMAIMGELFNINWQEKFNSKGWWDNEKSIQKNNL